MLQTAPLGNRLRTLIVSASAMFGWRIAAALESYELGLIESCESEAVAFELLVREPVDFVIALHQPPHLDATSLVRRLRALPRAASRHCHALLVAHEDDPDVVATVRAAGADGLSVGRPSSALLQDALASLARKRRQESTLPTWSTPIAAAPEALPLI